MMNPVGNLVFNPPIAGKPAPSARPPRQGETDTRPRVAQRGTKDNTCWYYAFNVLRHRVGQHPEVQDTLERKFEKAASALRKQWTQHEARLPDLCNQLNDPLVKHMFAPVTQNKPFGNFGAAGFSALFMLDPTLKTSMQDFVKQAVVPNFFEYLVAKKFEGRNAANRAFLKNVQDVAIDVLLAAKEQQMSVAFDIAQTVAYRAKLLDAVVRDVCAEKFGLTPVKWAPSDSLAVFFDAVQEHGHLFVGGLFGKRMYEAPPVKLRQQVGGHDILAWRPGSARLEVGVVTAHAVVVVGALKQAGDKGLVYFIDPDDSSHPADPKGQPIYAMSYATLVKHVTNLSGVQLVKGNTYPSAVTEVGYALGPVKGQLEQP